MGQPMRLLSATALSTFVVLSASFAYAQQPAGPAGAQEAPGAPGGSASSSSVEKARVHYERGLQLFNETNYDAALFEFERAYELAPSYKILYNMGRIQREQNNYAAALRSYSRYLREGGTAIPAERRAEVEKEIGVLKPRVAEVTVKVNIDGANVYADDVPVCAATIESSCIGMSPLREPIVVNGGRHKFTATKKGYSTATALISVVGSDTTEVRLELVDLTPPPPPKQNPWVIPTIAGWSATALTLIGGGITGALTLGARDDQEALRKAPAKPGLSAADYRTQLDEARDKTQTLAGVTNALNITSAVFAGASAYFTIKMIGFSKGQKEAAPKPKTGKSFDLQVSPLGVGATGTF